MQGRTWPTPRTEGVRMTASVCEWLSVWMLVSVNGCHCEWLSVWMIVSVNASQCEWLSVWMVVSVNVCQCEWLSVWMIVSVNGCLGEWLSVWKVVSVNGCQAECSSVWMISSVNDYRTVMLKHFGRLTPSSSPQASSNPHLCMVQNLHSNKFFGSLKRVLNIRGILVSR